MSLRALSLLEGRVLGVLVEKAHTVPDSYPLSLNALTLGCNQKTARDPVLSATEAEVQAAVDALKALSLAFESSGSRVTRYEHNSAARWRCRRSRSRCWRALLLRGPQTTSELRTNTERLHRFADLSSVEAFLEELGARADEKGGPLVLKLPRAPGAREARWAQLLTRRGRCLGAAGWRRPATTSSRPANWPRSRPSQTAMQSRTGRAARLVERLYAELGVARGATEA